MLDRYFATNLAPYPLLWQQHDPWLVMLSILMSISAAIVALHMTTLARHAPAETTRRLAIFSGALALGAGIWAMHFVAMLSFELCARGNFNLGMTALSILPSMGASWITLSLLTRQQLPPKVLVIGGVLVGAGVGAMHYIGVEATTLAPLIRYDPWMFGLSIIVAVVLGIVALWVRFGLEHYWHASSGKLTLLAGTVMGLAISTMHYTAMAALRFIQPSEILPRWQSVVPESVTLSLATAGITLALGLLAIAINVSLRHRQILERTQRSESRLRAVVDTAIDGVIIIDSHGIVQSFNGAAERMLGWTAAEIIGRNVNLLMPEPHHSAHDGYLATHLTTGRTRIIGTGREVDALRKDGTLLSIRLAVGRVAQADIPLFVGFLTDISERRAIENSLRHSEEQFRSLVGNIPGVTFRCRFDANWSMLFISDDVQIMTGWQAQDFVAGRIHFTQLIHAGDQQRVNEAVGQALAQHQAYRIDYRLTHRDGQIHWVSESGRGIYGAQGEVQWIDGVILDITATKARNAEFEGTVSAINRALAIVEFDLAGRVLTANENFLALMGYQLDEIVGQSRSLFCTAEQIADPAYPQFWQSLVEGQLASGEYLRLGKDRRPVWQQASYNPIFDAEGKVFKIVKFATDLSERRAMEQALRDAKDSAEQAAAARSSFLANMSHEIRTPMNAIIGFTDAVLDSSLSEAQRQQLSIVQRTSRSLLRLLNDILDTAKLEKGAVELEIEDFSLRDLCQQILTTLRVTADKKGLQLILDYPENEPDNLRGDALRLEQILMNLMGNAIKFTEQGHVTLQVRYQEQERATGTLLLAVEDTGIGIAPSQIDHIFSPFAQADASTTRRFGGTGLGTTISRQLVELMHGTITVHSTLGQGSTFSVHLPLPKGQSHQVRKHQRMIHLPALRLLAVDDVAENLDLLKLILSRQGHTVSLADGGLKALQLIQNTAYDLVLMDLQMPEIDGLETTRQIRAWEIAQSRPPVPIIALSASVLEEDRRNALMAGMDGFANKPVELPVLFAEIAKVLKLEADEQHELASVSARGATVTAAHSFPIDWEKGLRVWQQKPLLSAAIQRFLLENSAIASRLRDLERNQDRVALAATAHRVRGLAANLALPHLQDIFTQLETLARTGDALLPAQLIDHLESALQAVEQALKLSDVPDVPLPNHSSTTNTPETPLSPQQAALLHTALDQAKACLEHGELPEASLQILSQHLSEAQTAPLRAAIENFDFSKAITHLSALYALLPQISSEPQKLP